MIEVEIYYNEGITELYISDEINELIESYDKKDKDGIEINQLHLKLKNLCDKGFDNFIPTIIRPEWEQVYRIGFNDLRIRIIGFFSRVGTSRKQCFIAINCFDKKSNKLNRLQKNKIDKVVKIKKEQKWKLRK